ncbi:MAG: TetR/AcrR family transcriptional regulator [Gammaproteobacteria bacterium]|nr:TetR/AcrR family transcriptional regulator [Gammaproteobacteria bacterium]
MPEDTAINPDARFEQRRAEIIRAATEHINGGDFAAITLTNLARRIGMRYTGFYHYFDGKDHLAEETFSATLRIRDANIGAALTEDGGALHRIRSVVEKEASGPMLARMAYVDTLTPAQRKRVVDAMWVNVVDLAAIIEAGVADGSLRECDPLLTAALTLEWLDRFAGRTNSLSDQKIKPVGLYTTLADLVCMGALVPGEPLPDVSAAAVLLPALSTATEDGPERIEEVLRCLTIAFNRRGVAATSIQSEAAKLGVTKSVLYRCASTKEELVFFCMLRGLRFAEAAGLVADALTSRPIDEIVLWGHYLSVINNSPVGPLPRFSVDGALTDQHHRAIVARDRVLRARLRGRIQAAMDDGTLRPSDPAVIESIVTLRSSSYMRVAARRLGRAAFKSGLQASKRYLLEGLVRDRG